MDVEIKIEHRTSRENYRSVVSDKNAFFIEGGGTKGVYAIGILKYLFEENQYVNLDAVDLFGGTSVGSYLATALSIGYRKDDLAEITKNIDISSLVDSKYMFMSTLYRFFTLGHLYEDIGRENIIISIIEYKIDAINEHLGIIIKPKDLTFGHLKELNELYPTIYKNLLINVTDISRSIQIFMTTLSDKWSNIKIFDALLASSAIPFVFKPVTLYYNAQEDKYGYCEGYGDTINILVDGGVSTNNPLDYFLINKAYDNKVLDYNLWLLKFTSHDQYVKVDSITSLLKQLVDYLISGKNDIKMDLVHEEYNINCINLHSTAKTLDIYTQEQIQQIITIIYNKCITGELYFGN